MWEAARASEGRVIVHGWWSIAPEHANGVGEPDYARSWSDHMVDGYAREPRQSRRAEMRFLRRLPPGAGWLFLSAAILVVNAICLQAGGHRVLANWGYFGGAVAIGTAIAFGEWSRLKARRPR